MTRIPEKNVHTERSRQVAREDLVMFVNACFACSGQREFYSEDGSHRVSIDFLHRYILGNYRLLYSRTLSAGINHFNQAQIIVNLLATGRETPAEHRAEEGALIAAALRALPPHRAWRVFETLRQRGVNNRRSRAVLKRYLETRPDMVFDAVKYRRKMRAGIRHAHLRPAGEIGNFLFRGWQSRMYKTELFEAFREAHYSQEAVYKLPYSIAEGLAAKHGIPRALFLERIAPRMSANEKLRLQNTAAREKTAAPDVAWERQPLTKLALYALSLPAEERAAKHELLQDALAKVARLSLRRSPLSLGRVAAVLDSSYSSSGSSEKRRRPLAVAVAGHYLLSAAAREYHAFWTQPGDDPLRLHARGQTDLATPILDALDWLAQAPREDGGADLIVIISDGCENDPPRGAAEVLRVYRTKLDPERRTTIVHCNPVFDTDDFLLRPVSEYVPTVGLRDAEDLPTMLGFARFADGGESLADLETYLESRAERMIRATQSSERITDDDNSETTSDGDLAVRA